MTRPRPDDDDLEPMELVPLAAAPPEVAAERALAEIVASTSRESAANRAQARELIKALEGVQRSQEYLGTALREERGRSRRLFVLLAVVPIAAAAGAWYLLSHVESMRDEMRSRVDTLAATNHRADDDAAARASTARIAELVRDLDGVRRDLEASRDSLAEQNRHLETRETALAAAETRSDGARTEISALESEVKGARAKASSEAARSAVLEARVKELEASLAAKTAAAEIDAATAEGVPHPAATSAKPESAAPKEGDPKAEGGAASDSAKEPALDKEAVEAARLALNRLLAGSDAAVRYEIQALGGVVGKSLGDVRVVGTDSSGGVVRTIQAKKAEIVLDKTSASSVVMQFADGKLIVGRVEAPFFEGRYGLVLRGDLAKWRASGLATER